MGYLLDEFFNNDRDPSDFWDGEDSFSHDLICEDGFAVGVAIGISFGDEDGVVFSFGDVIDAVNNGCSCCAAEELDDVAFVDF